MIRTLFRIAASLVVLGAPLGAQGPTTRFIAVEKDVRLEVVEWGGSGRTVVLLAGLGNTARDFDEFVATLLPNYHVIGITRRGFAPSSIPTHGYTADSLANDVLAVIDSLGLKRPVLVGHSVAGEELSSIGSRFPERVSGLIYLDAGYEYAFYDSAAGSRWRPTPLRGKAFDVQDAIQAGKQRYSKINAPVLAIYAIPHRLRPREDRDARLVSAWMSAQQNAQVQSVAFERGVPGARVVRIPNGDHYVFKSNLGAVLNEMRSFIAALPP